MPPVHVLVDLENNQPKLDDVKGLVPDITHAWLFHSPQQANRLASFAPMGAQQTPVPISRPGKNALDFHLAFYLGYIAARNPGAKLVVVAIDRGYGPMVEHAKALDIEVTQVGFKAGAARPRKAAVKKAVAGKASAKRTPAAKAPAGKAPPAKKVAAKNVAEKKMAEKKVAEKKVAAKKAGASKPVAKKPAAPKPPVAATKKAAPAKKVQATNTRANETQAKKTAPAGAPAAAPTAAKARMGLAKFVANLHKMGERRPKKLKQLQRHLASLLGQQATEGAVASLLASLRAEDVVRVTGDAVSYGPAVACPGVRVAASVGEGVRR